MIQRNADRIPCMCYINFVVCYITLILTISQQSNANSAFLPIKVRVYSMYIYSWILI